MKQTLNIIILIGSLLGLNSCKKSSSLLSTNTKSEYKVGDTAFGGIVFYIDGSKKHGMVCALTDTAVSYEPGSNWNRVYVPTVTGATNTAFGTGALNTSIIVPALANEWNGKNAASYCKNFRGGGYNDWFLPSKDELDTMYHNLGSKGLGGFYYLSYTSQNNYTFNYYWSSSEAQGQSTQTPGLESQACSEEMDIAGRGYKTVERKWDVGYVRAARTF